MEIVGSPKPPAGLSRMLFRLPVQLYRMRLGWLLGGRFMLLNHIGRKSGKLRRSVVEVADHDPGEGSYVAASGFGTRSDWYRNVLAAPDVTVQVGGHVFPMTATPLTAAEGAQVMARYARRHPRAARRLCRFMGYEVDGTEAGYLAVGRHVPFLRFRPRG